MSSSSTSSPIFKRHIPNRVFIELLDNIAIKTEQCYVLNHGSYKKGMYSNFIIGYIENLKPYYQTSKQNYLERKLTYKSFMTIVRQICNFNKINYTSEIKHDKSDYDIVYYIYI